MADYITIVTERLYNNNKQDSVVRLNEESREKCHVTDILQTQTEILFEVKGERSDCSLML